MRHVIGSVLVLALLSPATAFAADLNAKQYRQVQQNLRKTPGLIEKIIADCASTMVAKGRVSEEMAGSLGKDRNGAAEIYCSRVFTAIAAERLSHKDYLSIDRGTPTPAAQRVIEGR